MKENARNTEEKKLSVKQQKLISELMSGKTIRDASKAVDINEVTAYRWMKEPLFLKEYQAAKQASYNEKLDMLRSGVTTALKTLHKHMISDETKPYVQVQAASKWLDATIEVNRITDLERKIAELEERLNNG